MLKILKPLNNLTSEVDSYSLTTDEHTAWATGTAYAAGAKVAYNLRAWQAVAAISSSTTAPATGSLEWVDAGPLNRWAMFDGKVSTRTVGTNTGLSVTLTPGRCNGLALLDIYKVKTFTITASYPVTNGSAETTVTEHAYGIMLTTVVTTTSVTMTYAVTLESRNVSDWKGFFIEPYEIATDIFIQLPSRANMTISLAIVGADPAVAIPIPEIGSFILGNFIELGEVEYGVSAGIEDYSNIVTDEFGQTTFVQRDYVKRVSYPLMVPNYNIRRTFSTLAALRATPAVFIGSDNYQHTPFTVFGFVEDFNLGLQFSTHSVVNIDVRGVQI